MAKSIGFRVEGKAVHWAVVSDAAEALILEDSGSFTPPRAYAEAAALTFVRGRVGSILDQHAPSHGGIKYTEATARGAGDGPRARARIEGVILQRLDEEGVQVLGGAYNTISPRLGVDSAKKLLDEESLRGLEWGAVSALHREAILVSVAAMEAR
jgi:hypothetical protein